MKIALKCNPILSSDGQVGVLKKKKKEKTDKGIKLGREGVVSRLDGTKRTYK